MRARGFNLIEMTIALAVVALLVGIAVPVIDNVTRAELKAAASKTSGMIKATYDTAVLNGQPARLVFDFKANTLTAEVASGRVTLLDKDAPRKDDDKDEDEKEDSKTAALAAMAKREVGGSSVRRTASWTRVPGTVAFELPSGVHIQEVMAEHMRDAQKEGKATVHFFPMGYCEHAVIHFEDDSQRVYAVEIEPLTGRTRISNTKIEYKEPK